jgi:hypothetical protein
MGSARCPGVNHPFGVRMGLLRSRRSRTRCGVGAGSCGGVTVTTPVAGSIDSSISPRLSQKLGDWRGSRSWEMAEAGSGGAPWDEGESSGWSPAIGGGTPVLHDLCGATQADDVARRHVSGVQGSRRRTSCRRYSSLPR